MSQTHSTQKSQYVQYGDRSKYQQIVYLRFAKRVNFMLIVLITKIIRQEETFGSNG